MFRSVWFLDSFINIKKKHNILVSEYVYVTSQVTLNLLTLC